MSFAPRTMSAAPTTTTIITIHIVNRVLLIAGWNVTRPAASPAAAGAKSMMLWGAGNSSEPVMKQTGNEQGSPGFSLFGGGTYRNASTSTTRTATMSAIQRPDSRRLRGDGDPFATASVAT